ncbi:hypothetical protein ACP1MA_000207 [Salmonella enterica subsp. diarizonae serovar 65:c:z str. SA20044251]
MLKHTNNLTIDIMNRAERALLTNEEAYAVLSMWLDGIPNNEMFYEESIRVSAVMTLLNKSIRELTDTRDYFREHIAHITRG